jgi:hypothetical protein
MSENQIDLFPRLQSSTSPDSQRLNLLALARVRGIGEASLKAFLKKFTDLQGGTPHRKNCIGSLRKQG